MLYELHGINQLAKTNPMYLEARIPTSYALWTWASLLAAVTGIVLLFTDLERWRRNKRHD
jgi:hypothetical protein